MARLAKSDDRATIDYYPSSSDLSSKLKLFAASLDENTRAALKALAAMDEPKREKILNELDAPTRNALKSILANL